MYILYLVNYPNVADKWACSTCINDGVIPDDLMAGSSTARSTDTKVTTSPPAEKPALPESSGSVVERQQSTVSGRPAVVCHCVSQCVTVSHCESLDTL